VQVYTPDKSTDQLAVWQSLIDALEWLDTDREKAQLAGRFRHVPCQQKPICDPTWAQPVPTSWTRLGWKDMSFVG
jgi:hypothetical protein